jgi:hypothetical protein
MWRIDGMIDVFAKLEAVSLDTENKLYIIVSKRNRAALQEIAQTLKLLEGKEVDIKVKLFIPREERVMVLSKGNDYVIEEDKVTVHSAQEAEDAVELKTEPE